MKKTIIRRFLDKLFRLKKLSLILPLAVAAVMLTLGAIFKDKNANEGWFLFLATPLFSAVFFGFVYFLLRMFARFKNCPDWYTDSLELFSFIVFSLSAIFQIIDFIKDVNTFSIAMSLCLVSCSAISLAHNKRN